MCYMCIVHKYISLKCWIIDVISLQLFEKSGAREAVVGTADKDGRGFLSFFDIFNATSMPKSIE